MAFIKALTHILFATTLVFPRVYARPRLSEIEERALHIRSITVNALPGGSGGAVPIRLEIRQLQQNADQWNLYLLGLQRMQQADPSDPLSWYQIAGIHGRPYQVWDDVQAGSNPNAGYCAHSSTLFPTWHRPYLALYEQALYNNIQAVVNEFQGGDRDRYSQAAQTLRMPYWDWAASQSGQSVFPESVMGSPTVEVNTPSGRKTIDNPLFSYKFKTTSGFPSTSQFAHWQETVRYPTQSSFNGGTPQSQNNLVSRQLSASQPSFRHRLYNLLTSYHDYTYFSNKAWLAANPPEGYDSIESIHDQVHGLAGSGGHMSVVDYAAFDPVFWLHHTNVDRVIAIWQALNPDSWVTPQITRSGTFTNNPGMTEDVNTPLTPFRNSNSQFFTSNDIRSTKSFGYAYPELDDWNHSPEEFMSNLKASVNKLYGDNPNQRKRDVAAFTTEWVANIRVQKYAVGQTFFVHFILGEFNRTDPFSWSFLPNLVGTHTIFSNTINGEAPTDMPVTGVIPLTHALRGAVESGALRSLDPVDVTPFLQANLHWRVTTTNDQEVSREDVQDLRVSVASANVTIPQAADEFPVWGPMVVNTAITKDRIAGLTDISQV